MNMRIKKKINKMRGQENKITLELGNMMFGNSRGKYGVNRDWLEALMKAFNQCNIDAYGYYNEHNKYSSSRDGFENDIFKVNPYYWGDDESIQEEPNFVYKPSNFQLSWYKYALRDSYMNKDISLRKFKEILNKCVESYKRSMSKSTYLTDNIPGGRYALYKFNEVIRLYTPSSYDTTRKLIDIDNN